MKQKLTYFYSLLLTALFLLPWSVKAEQLNESFESTTFAPEGWTTIHVSGNKSWERYTSSYSNYGHESKSCAQIMYVSGGHENYLVTPQLKPQTGEKLTFYTKQNYNGSTTITVEVSTTTNEASAFTKTLFTYVDAGATTSTWAEQVIDLADYVDQNIYLAFHAVDNYGFTFYLDDVSGVTLKPESCPKTGTPAATAKTTTTATIEWTENGSATDWNLQYKKSSESSWSASIPVETTPLGELTGLAPGTTYDIRVQANCGDEQSDWKDGTPFDTECGTATLPFEPTFANGVVPTCWTASEWASGWSGKWYTYLVSGTTYGLQYQASSSSAGSTIQTPAISLSQAAELTFEYTNYYSGRRVTSQVIVSDGTTTKTINLANTESTSLVKDTIDLTDVDGTNFTGKEVSISFKGTKHSSSSGTGYLKIANIKVAAKPGVTPPSCPGVTSVTLSEKHYNSVTVNWVSDATSCDIHWSLDNGASWTRIATDVASSPKTFDVQVGKSYKFEVKPSCGDTTTWAACTETYSPTYPTPGIPSVTAETTSASVTWTAADGADGYEYVLMAGTAAAVWTTPIAATSPLALDELTEGTNYTVYVRAKFGDGRGAASSKNFTTATVAPAFTSAAPTTTATTATVALEAYTGTATQFQYVVMLGTTAANWTGATLIAPTTNIALTGLTSGTSYTLYVRAYYSENVQSAAVSKAFSTACAAEAVPFNFGFEENLSPCWKALRNDSYAFSEPSISPTSPQEGDQCLRFFGGGTNKKAILVLPPLAEDITNLQISFYYKNASTYSSRPQFAVGYITDVTDITTYTQVQAFERNTSWTSTGDVELSGATTGARIAICCFGGTDSYNSYIDNIAVSVIPSCEKPTDLKVTTVGAKSARFFWTSSESAWKLQYKAEGEADWTEVAVNTNPFTLEGLTIGTNYQAKIQSACGSEFTDVVEFSTWCDLADAADLPLEEDFATGTKPACFEFLSTTAYPQVTSNLIWFQGTNKQIVVLPGFNIELNKLSIKFDLSVSSAMLELGYFTAEGSEFQSLGVVTESGAEIDLSTKSAPASAGYLAIRYNYASTPYANGSVDNIRVRKTPTCLKPTNLAAMPGVGSAEISWTAGGSEAAWNLQYKLASAADWTDAIGEITNPFVLNGLEQGASYKVRVQAACEGEDPSDWSAEASFVTNCANVDALPFENSFDANLSNCWKTYAASNYSVYVMSNELHATAPKTDGSESVLVLPAMDAALNTLGVSFNYKGSNGTIEVGYVTDATDKTTFVAVGDAFTVSDAYQQAIAPLTSVGNAAGNIAIRFKGNNADGDFVIDNLRVAETIVYDETATNTFTVADKTLDVVMTRTLLLNGDYNTLCLPFSLSEEQLADADCPLNNFKLKIFDYSAVVNDELQIAIAGASSIEAGVPYFAAFQGTPAANKSLHLFKDVKITANTADSKTSGQVTYQGVLNTSSLANQSGNAEPEILYLGPGNMIYWPSDNLTIKGFRAYFAVNYNTASSAPVRPRMSARIVERTEVVTGCENVSVDGKAAKLLENNQVVIIRNGVKYNIQGQVISK